MKIENIIRRVLREEQEEEKILKIPGIRFFNNDWNILQKFLESQGNPRYSIGGDLNLRDSDIESLGNLVRVEGDLDLYYSDVKSLGDLEYVGGDLNLIDTDIETLGKLERVEGFLTLESCQNLESLGDLEYVGNWLDINHTNVESLGNLKYVGSHLFLRYTPLSKKYTRKQIRKIVEVVAQVYL
jgi:hypothetical protein